MLTIPKQALAVLALLFAASIPHAAHAGGSYHGHGGHGHGGYGHYHGGYHGGGYHGGGYHGGGYYGHGGHYGHYHGYGYYGGYYPYYGFGYYAGYYPYYGGYYRAYYPYAYYPGYAAYYGGWGPVATGGVAIAGAGYADQSAYVSDAPAASDSAPSCAVARRVNERGVRTAATVCVDQDGGAYVVQGSEYVLAN